MEELILSTKSQTSRIIVGGNLATIKDYTENARTILITDKNVFSAFEKVLSGFELIVLPPGEASKSLSTIEHIAGELLKKNADREVFLIGVGGGVVSDITGLVASFWLRGVRHGFFPTTLLAQVDASIGGKTGINFSGFKNIIGKFKQPSFCVCDLNTLKTLPYHHYTEGLAEITKHALIYDSSLFFFLEQNVEGILNLNATILEKMVRDAIAVKVQIVSNDEKEANERMKLNFGHTIAHAIELVNKISHGDAVSLGIVIEAKISEALIGKAGALVPRVKRLLNRFNLPTEISVKTDEILSAVMYDKKRFSEHIKFPVLNAIGQCAVQPIKLKTIEEILHAMY